MAQSSNLPFDTGTLLAGIRRWVEIESPTTDAAAVNRCADAVAAEAQQAGMHVTRIEGRDGYGDHLLVEAPWNTDAQGILVLSHLDTVHPIGMLAERLPFRVEGDIAYGPGIYDMKGGAYLALAAAGVAARDPAPKLPLRHLFLSDEEVGSPTSRALIEAQARRARYVLVTEPAREGGRIVTARKGTARFDIEITGRPAHSGARHQDGRSAIRELAHQVLALEAMTDYARDITVNVGIVAGGTRANVVSEFARAEVDMRVPDMASEEAMVARILALEPHDPDVKLVVTGGLNRPPYEKSPAIAALFEHARKLAAEIGFELADLKTGGGSDGNFTATIAPTLDGLGVDGKGGHTDYEQLYVSSLVPRAMLLLRLIETLGSGVGGEETSP
jgi:glutamate carboxypeptidase